MTNPPMVSRVDDNSRGHDHVPGRFVPRIAGMTGRFNGFLKPLCRKPTKCPLVLSQVICPLWARGVAPELAMVSRRLGEAGSYAPACGASERSATTGMCAARPDRFGAIDFDDPSYRRRPYDRWNAYGQ